MVDKTMVPITDIKSFRVTITYDHVAENMKQMLETAAEMFPNAVSVAVEELIYDDNVIEEAEE